MASAGEQQSTNHAVFIVANFVHRRTQRALGMMDDFVSYYERQRDARVRRSVRQHREQPSPGQADLHHRPEGEASSCRGVDFCETNPMVPTMSAGSDFEAALAELLAKEAQAGPRDFHHTFYDDTHLFNMHAANRDVSTYGVDVLDEALLSVAGTEDMDSDTMSSRTSFSVHCSATPDSNPEPPAADVSSVHAAHHHTAMVAMDHERARANTTTDDAEDAARAPFRGVGDWERIPLGRHSRSAESDVESISSGASLSDAGSEDTLLLRHRAVVSRMVGAKTTFPPAHPPPPPPPAARPALDGVDLGQLFPGSDGVYILY